MAKKHFKMVLTAAAGLAALLLAAGCSKTASESNAQEPVEQAYTGDRSTNEKADEPDVAVQKCERAYDALFGAGGCVPGLLSEDRITAACQSYSAWAAKGDECGSKTFADFYSCLAAIECAMIFDKDKPTFPKEYNDCRTQFAKDMDVCLHQKTE